MPFVTDDCTPLLRHCVITLFRALACKDEIGTPLPSPAVNGGLTLNNPSGQKIPDGNGGMWLPGQQVQRFAGSVPETQTLTPVSTWTTVTENGCDYWALKTCDLPANVDSAYDPADPASANRALEVGGTSYTISLSPLNGQEFTCDFVIDAANDYTADEIGGCIPLTALSDVAGPAPGASEFAAAVCAALQTNPSTGADLPSGTPIFGRDCQWHNLPAGASSDTFVTWATDPVNETVTFTSADGATTVTVPAAVAGGNTSVMTDNGDGTYSHDDGTGTVTTIDTTTGNTSVLTNNGDGTWTHDDGTGTLATITTGNVADNGDGTVTISFPDGSTQTIPVELCASLQALTDLPAGTNVAAGIVIGDDGECYKVPADDLCKVDGPNGLTATTSGAFFDGCTIEPMSADGNPETDYPAAGFPELWRQAFSGGVTGTEYWVVLNDMNGNAQWHQLG